MLAVALVAALLGIGGGILTAKLPGEEQVSEHPERLTPEQDPQGFGGELRNLACDPAGRETIVAVGWGNLYGSINPPLQQWPGSRYLDTRESCRTQWPEIDGQVPRYVVYLPTFPDAAEACAERMTAAHVGDFATTLREGNTVPVVCPCAMSPEAMPELRPYVRLSTQSRMFADSYRRMLTDAQFLQPNREVPRGHFGRDLESATRDLQSDNGLMPSGIVDAQTWATIQSEACELYDF